MYLSPPSQLPAIIPPPPVPPPDLATLQAMSSTPPPSTDTRPLESGMPPPPPPLPPPLTIHGLNVPTPVEGMPRTPIRRRQTDMNVLRIVKTVQNRRTQIENDAPPEGLAPAFFAYTPLSWPGGENQTLLSASLSLSDPPPASPHTMRGLEWSAPPLSEQGASLPDRPFSFSLPEASFPSLGYEPDQTGTPLPCAYANDVEIPEGGEFHFGPSYVADADQFDPNEFTFPSDPMPTPDRIAYAEDACEAPPSFAGQALSDVNSFADVQFTFDTPPASELDHSFGSDQIAYSNVEAIASGESGGFDSFSFSPHEVVFSPSSESTEYRRLEDQLDKVHDLSTLKQMILDSAGGRPTLHLRDLNERLAEKQPLFNEHHRNWNEEFQTLLESPDSLDKFKRLAHLAHDFVYAATTYAKIIISEQCLSNSRKTIPPVSVGGVAGGEKYLCQNIMFKFALDAEIAPGLYMYGGKYVDHESAMKAAAHELKGLCQYNSTLTQGLSYPLLAYIDYKGFRVIAISVLPIGGDSLLYGSSDSGLTVQAKDPTLNQLMENAAGALNLQSHVAGINPQTCARISSCGDLEAHIGTDGRYYVLDFARAFPAEAPPRRKSLQNPRGVYYRLLRPELVRSSDTPLNPDAFTSWGDLDPLHRTYNGDVFRCTMRLHNEIIPAFAKRLDEEYQSLQDTLTIEMHRSGINVRHLGQIRQYCSAPAARELLTVEMIVRVVKNQLRDSMRATMRQAQGLSQEPFKAIVIKIFNLVLHKNEPKGADFWKIIQQQARIKFANHITSSTGFPYELPQSEFFLTIDKASSIRRLFERLFKLLGVRVTDQAMEQLRDNPYSFEFVDADVAEVYAQPHFMDIIDYAEAMALERMAQSKDSGREKLRLLELSAKKFELAFNSTPANYMAIYNWGEVLFQQARHTERIHVRLELLQQAVTKLRFALSIHPVKEAYFHAGEIYLTLAMNDKRVPRFVDASDMFAHAVKEDHSFVKHLIPYLKEILTPPTLSFQLRGLITLCQRISETLPASREILQSWSDAILELAVHYPSFSHDLFREAVSHLTEVVMVAVQQLPTCASFCVELVDQVTELAFHHKHLYYFVSRLYPALCLTQTEHSTLLVHWGMSLWEYAKTVDYLQYGTELDLAAEKLEAALQLDETCLDDEMKLAVGSQGGLFSQWLDLIENSTILKNRFFSFLTGTTNLKLTSTQTNRGAAISLAKYLAPSLERISFHQVHRASTILAAMAEYIPNLKEITLEECRVSVDDMQQVFRLIPTLECVNITDFQLNSNIVIWATQLRGLRRLRLQGIRWLKDRAKFLCARSETLEELSLAHSTISDAEFRFLTGMKNLRVLSIPYCTSVEHNIAELVQSLSHLTTLDVSGGYRDTDSILAAIIRSGTTCLTSLNISRCRKLTDGGLSHLAVIMNTNALRSLNLSDCCRVTEGGLATLADAKGITSLRSLNLDFNGHLQESSIAYLLQRVDARQLEELHLARCRLSDATLQNLAFGENSPTFSLRHVSLRTTKLTDLSWLVERCPHLEEIDLRECPIDGRSLDALRENCKKLRAINLSKCNAFPERSFIKLLEELAGTVTHLRLNQCLPVTSATLLVIAESCTNLDTLELEGNLKINDGTIVHLQNLPHLRYLNLAHCTRVKSNSIIRLAKSSPFLQHLDVSHTTLVDGKGAIQVAKFAKNLQTFAAEHTINITQETLDWMRRYRPDIFFKVDRSSDMVSELKGHNAFLSQRLRIHFRSQLNTS